MSASLTFLVVAGSFLACFVLVCLVAYLFFRGKKANEELASVELDDEVKRLAEQGKRFQAMRAFVRKQTGARPQRVGAWWAVLFLAGVAAAMMILAPLGGLFRADVLGAFGGALLVAGLPLARRFGRPDRFRVGVVALALAFATFWPLQYVAASIKLLPNWEWNAAMHVAAFLVSGCLLSGGLESIRRASNTPEDDAWEFL
jgi:hypothetical protein